MAPVITCTLFTQTTRFFNKRIADFAGEFGNNGTNGGLHERMSVLPNGSRKTSTGTKKISG